MTRVERTDWRTRALCALPAYRSIDWFPNPGDQQGIAAAKAVCADCPVWRDCLADALREEGGSRSTSRDGIFGGLTGGQRFSIYKRAARARRAEGEPKLSPCGTRAAYERHRRKGEPIDEACRAAKLEHLHMTRGKRQPARQANADADNRLRRTGTSKEVAA
ncbi:WhiB family transcriptional regulator [Streptomyces tendae]|uniref:WhiB family transcriptional regulator n=1 Tax=Streptomyces tendae TaxID=1932 RepID=UPI0038086FEE